MSRPLIRFRPPRATVIRPWAAVILLALVVGCGQGGPVEEAAPVGPGGVVVVALDGVRWDHLGFNGGTAPATPAFDALAAESARFELAFAQSPDVTASAASLLTGLYPTTHGVVDPEHTLPADVTTLSEVLREAGYATAAFGEVATGLDAAGLDQGFDTFQIADAPGQSAVAWIRANVTRPFFVVISGWAPPAFDATVVEAYAGESPAGFDERLADALLESETSRLTPEDEAYLARAYEARIAALDERLGAFMAEFREMGLDRTSTLVVTATCGRDLGEHEMLAGGVYATSTRVPLLLRLPEGRDARAVDEVVELVDVMPTLLELAGTAVPPPVQGGSLLPILGGSGTPPYIAFGESFAPGHPRFATLAGYQLVATDDRPSELFYLLDDPNATEDLAGDMPDRVEVLEEYLGAWSKMVSAASYDPDRRTEELDDATLEQLKSLGYIQ